jgi:hypothetical protein
MSSNAKTECGAIPEGDPAHAQAMVGNDSDALRVHSHASPQLRVPYRGVLSVGL